MLSTNDKAGIWQRHAGEFQKHGYSLQSLLWLKGKQDIRYDILTSFYECEGKRFLDIGCGFGDLNKILAQKCRNYQYLGLDLSDEFIGKAREIYTGSNIRFVTAEFLEYEFAEKFDFIIASGVFNYKLKDIDNYRFIESALEKALDLSVDGLAFNFISDKVDYRYEELFYSSPEKILGMAYRFSRNVILRNDYMPFEFSLCIFKDDSFLKEDTLFIRYKNGLAGRK
jgi:SAM-dependent methyltransferase